MILSLNHPAVEVIRFPDGQPHVRVRKDQIPGEVDIEQRIRNAEELHLLCCLVDALRSSPGTGCLGTKRPVGCSKPSGKTAPSGGRITSGTSAPGSGVSHFEFCSAVKHYKKH